MSFITPRNTSCLLTDMAEMIDLIPSPQISGDCPFSRNKKLYAIDSDAIPKYLSFQNLVFSSPMPGEFHKIFYPDVNIDAHCAIDPLHF